MSKFGTGSTGNEDLVFSLGLDGITLVDNLESTEQKVGDSLGKIGKHFQNLKTTVDDAGKNNKFKQNLTDTSKTANTLTAQLRSLLTALRDVNAELAKTRASGSANGALAQQLALVNRLQQAVAKLQAGNVSNATKITGAANQATSQLNRMVQQAQVAANKLNNVGQSAQNTGTHLTNMGNKGVAANKKIGLSGQTLNQQFQQTGGYLRNISTVLSTIGLGGGIFALIYGFKQLVKDGIDLNAQVEQAKISLAAEVVASAKLVEVDGKRVEGLQAIKAVQGQVGEIVGQLKTDALFVNGTFEDLLGIAQSITPQVTRMGGGLQQVHRLTQLTGIAASVLNVEFKTAQTGLSQLLNGNVVGRNAFVRRLPIPVDELKAGLKDVNGRAEFLIKTLQRLEEAGPLIMTSFKGALESMKDLLQQVSGRAFEPLQKRLQGGFNSFISGNVIKDSDGTMQYSKELEATISRISRLVDTVLAQIILLARELAGNGSRSFLDVAEETLPKIIAGIGSLLSVLAQVGGFLTDHAGLVLKLLGYYLTFNLAVGVFNSLAGVVNKVNGIFVTMQALSLSLGGGITNLRGTIAALAGGLQALATKTIIGVVLIAVMELISGFMDASQSAKDFKIAADDINKLNFDTAIGQIRKMVQELREGDNMWSRFWYTVTHGGPKLRVYSENIDRLAGDAVGQSVGILDKLGITNKLPRNIFGGFDNRAAVLGNMGNFTGQGIEALRAQQTKLETEARTASDKRREGIKQELAQNAVQQEALRQTLTLLKESVLAEEALKKAGAPGSKEQEAANRYLKNSDISLYAAAGRTVPAVEVGLNMAPRTKVTPNTAVTPPDEDAARRLLRNESALVNALEQVSQASARVLDRNNQRQQSEMDLLVSKHILTVQQAAAREIQIAKDTADAKIGVQQNLFQKLSDNKLVDLSGAKEALGLGKGSLTFAELRGVTEENIAQALADMQSKAETGNKTDQAKFQKQIHDLEVLGKIVAAIHSEEEKLGGTIAENSRRIEKANEDAVNTGNEQSAQMKERAAQLDVEQAKLFDIATTLEDRISREQRITAEIVKQAKAEVDRKAQKEKNDNNERLNWTPEQKTAANAIIDANAEREKKFLDAKEQIALAQRIIDIKDQEITLGQTGTQLREIELGTLKQLLGAENPLVAAKQNELTLAKAATMELQAQARYAAAAELRSKGQNTAAREAEKAGDVLHAQAAALRAETTNYFQVLGSGIEQLSGLLGRFGGIFGSFTSGLGQLFGGIGNLSKLDLGKIFNGAKNGATGVTGLLKGVMGVANPIAAVASTALGLFQTFFDIFQAGWKKLLNEAHDKIQDALDTSLGNLRAGRSTLKQTVDDIKNQLDHVEDKYPKAKGGAPWWSWIMPVVGASMSIYNGLSDKARQEAIDQDKLALGKQIEQMAKDAQEALWVLEHQTLPALRVTPAMREFESSLEKIRTELQGLAGTPGITQADLNDMFNIRIADLARDLQGQMLDQRQEYLDVLKHERDLKQQLTDLDKEAAQVQDDYKTQRAQILGLATRELSKSEQLAKLKADQQQKLDDIAKRKADLQTELDYVEKQKAAYEAVYGVVTDIGAYEIGIQDELLAKTKERLTSLSDFFKEVQAWMTGPMWNFITNNGQTTANGNPYALPVVLVNPTPITNPEPTNPGDNFGGDQVNYNMNGDIYVGGNMTQGEAKQAFLEAWRAFNQGNAARGLAHSNA